MRVLKLTPTKWWVEQQTKVDHLLSPGIKQIKRPWISKLKSAQPKKIKANSTHSKRINQASSPRIRHFQASPSTKENSPTTSAPPPPSSPSRPHPAPSKDTFHHTVKPLPLLLPTPPLTTKTCRSLETTNKKPIYIIISKGCTSCIRRRIIQSTIRNPMLNCRRSKWMWPIIEQCVYNRYNWHEWRYLTRKKDLKYRL